MGFQELADVDRVIGPERHFGLFEQVGIQMRWRVLFHDRVIQERFVSGEAFGAAEGAIGFRHACALPFFVQDLVRRNDLCQKGVSL
jgi:hypothetical protein